MINTNTPRIERAMTKLFVPYEKGEIAFASSSFGSDTYQAVGKEILSKNLRVPTGDYTASLLHPAYCNPQFSDEPEFKNIRDLMGSNWLWVFNQNLWTDKGVYVIQDLKAIGKSNPLDINQLEKMLKDSKEIKDVRFSQDGRVRFAPKETYKLGEHTSNSLSNDGFVVASYNIDGAKKLGEVSSKFKSNPKIYGIKVNEGNQLELRVSALSEDFDWLHVDGDIFGDYGGSLAFGVL